MRQALFVMNKAFFDKGDKYGIKSDYFENNLIQWKPVGYLCVY